MSSPPPPALKTGDNIEKKIDLNAVLGIVKEYFKESLPYFLMFGLFVLILTLFIIASFYKQDTVFLQKYRYIMMVIFPILIMVYLFLRKGKSDFNPTIIMMIGALITFGMLIIFISYIKKPTFLSTNSIVFGSYIISILLVVIFIIGLAIAYKVLKNSVRKMRGWPGFVVNFIFFIPCLVSDFIDYIFAEFKNAPNTVFVLFILELILILGYIYAPKLLKYITTKNGIVLQNQPVYLNKSNILSDSSIFLLHSSVSSSIIGTDISSNVYNSNFGLSMWIYVNNMGLDNSGNTGSVLFQVASPNDLNGKPCIRYMGNDKWNFIFSDQLTKINKLSSKEIGPFLTAAKINNKNNETYKKLLDIETKYSSNPDYTVSYSYSYGILPILDKLKIPNFTSIKLMLTQINVDFNTYKTDRENQNSLFQKNKKRKVMVKDKNNNYKLTEINNKYYEKIDAFTIENMYNLVQSITQTVTYNTKEQYIMTIPSQKWNHIVFNYFENNVDLFINGNLERSMDLKNNPILQLPTDNISVGDTNGIHGSICNLVYYNNPMTQTKISQIYNTYSIRNPPV